MKHIFSHILLLFGLSSYLLAQSTLDTIHLPEVILNESKAQIYTIGGNTQTIHPIFVGKSSTATLSDLLSQNSSIFIKKYGALATPTFRGTAASHTLLLWNDIPLNSLSTGQIDMNLLPTNAFNQLQIAFGSSASIFGSGALGGSIHLNNLVDFKQKNHINLSIDRGSFGLAANQLALKHASSKYFFKLSYNKLLNENNFSFINTTKINNPLEYFEHARVEAENLQSVFAYKYNANNKIEAHFWKTENKREIPANMTVPIATAMQFDNANRFLLNSTHLHSLGKLNIKLARMQEDFNYQDEPKNIDSKILAKSYIAFTDYAYCFNLATLNIGAAFTHNNIESNNYQKSPKKENDKAIYASLQPHYKGFAADASVRKQMHTNNELPLIPSFGVKQKICNAITVRAKSNKSFRLPTFNERFWIGLGNEDLKAENGWNNEAGFDINIKGLQLSATAFNLKVTDWIQWSPDESGQWTPKNIKQVLSRGIEAALQYKKHIRAVECLFFANYQYNQSTNEKGINKLDNSVGKQLIYTPYHKGNLAVILKEKDFQFSINQSYNGAVFTTSDNTDSLKDYLLTDIAFAYQLNLAPLDFQLTIKNLQNKSYQPYKNYPAAGRTYLLTLNYIIN